MSDKALRADDRLFRWISLAILGGTAILVVAYGLREGWQALAALPGVAGTVWISKLAIFSGAIEGAPYDPWTLAVIAWVLDLDAVVILLSGLISLEELPAVGRYIAHTRRRAFRTLQTYPGLRRMAVGGIVLFVFVPIPGSGSVIGSIIGQITGLPRTWTLLAIGIGEGFAVLTYAALAQMLGDQWETIAKSPWLALASLVVAVVFGFLAWIRVQRVLQRA